MRLDIIAGLTAAAVVVPKALAYATIAGLPVQVGLYTASVPMVVYALLGTSRVLSVSTTTTIAILTGAELARVARAAVRSWSRPRRRWLCWSASCCCWRRRSASASSQLHFRAGPDRIQVRHRPGHRRRSDSEAARHPHRQGRILQGSALDRPQLPETSIATLVLALLMLALIFALEKFLPMPRPAHRDRLAIAASAALD